MDVEEGDVVSVRDPSGESICKEREVQRGFIVAPWRFSDLSHV